MYGVINYNEAHIKLQYTHLLSVFWEWKNANMYYTVGGKISILF